LKVPPAIDEGTVGKKRRRARDVGGKQVTG